MTYIVELEASRAWLTDPTDPGGTAIVCGTRDTDGPTSTLDGELRYFAGGLIEGIARDQDDWNSTVTLAHLSPADKDRVLQWRGRPLLWRTVDGERRFVFFVQANVKRLLRTTPEDGSGGEVTFDVQVTFGQVSVDETQL